jgi:hypothetical protein
MLYTDNSAIHSKSKSNTSRDIEKIRDIMSIPINQNHRRKMSVFSSQHSRAVSSLTKKSSGASLFSQGKEAFISINSRINQEEEEIVRKKNKKQQEERKKNAGGRNPYMHRPSINIYESEPQKILGLN